VFTSPVASIELEILRRVLAVTPLDGNCSAALDAARTGFKADFLSPEAAGTRL